MSHETVEKFNLAPSLNLVLMFVNCNCMVEAALIESGEDSGQSEFGWRISWNFRIVNRQLNILSDANQLTVP